MIIPISHQLASASADDFEIVVEDTTISETSVNAHKPREVVVLVPDGVAWPFACLAAARAWVERFVRWYNEEHRHSRRSYVTPRERHEGRHLDILAQRRRVYEAARARHPERRAGPTRNCDPIPVVCLNPERAANHVIKQSAKGACDNYPETYRYSRVGPNSRK